MERVEVMGVRQQRSPRCVQRQPRLRRIRTETLRRLEEEQKEFGSFLERLRFAKDKAEFDQFMSERRNRPPAPPTEEQPAA